MKRLIAALYAALALQVAAAATTWKVTTWNLEWFPSGKPDFTDAKVEAQRTAEAAKILRDLDSDIILLQEVRDIAAAQALADQVGRGHQVVVVSRFKFGEQLGQQQQVILAKFPARASYARDWKTRQGVTPTRGFAFAAFPLPDGRVVGVYSLHLKSNAISRNAKEPQKQEALNRVQRELAATQLLEHAAEVQRLPDFKLAAMIVGGDFNTDPRQERFANEKTLPFFTAAGFTSSLLTLPLEKRTTIPGKGRYPDTTFDYLLFWKANPVGDPKIVPTEVSDHRPVTFMIELPGS